MPAHWQARRLVGTAAVTTALVLAVAVSVATSRGRVGNTQAPDGAHIASDPALFSAAVRAEFVDMNQTFAELGFELEVFQQPPSLADITSKYGDPDRSEDVDVMLGLGADQRRAVLSFAYYGDIGFGVRPDDPDQAVVRIKRRGE